MVPPGNMVQTALPPVQLVFAVINIECGKTLKIWKRETKDLLGMIKCKESDVRRFKILTSLAGLLKQFNVKGKTSALFV